MKEIYIQKQKEKPRKGIETFLPKVKDKEIEITLMNGLTFKAKLLAYSKYEILVELIETKKELIIFKHGILSINLNERRDKNES
jgi:sRNA-binding regulator protein Hfq